MEVNKAELRIPLPRKRTLRVLTLYGGGVVLLLIILDMMVRALRLPAWTMSVAVLCAIITVRLLQQQPGSGLACEVTTENIAEPVLKVLCGPACSGRCSPQEKRRSG